MWFGRVHVYGGRFMCVSCGFGRVGGSCGFMCVHVYGGGLVHVYGGGFMCNIIIYGGGLCGFMWSMCMGESSCVVHVGWGGGVPSMIIATTNASLLRC